MIDWEWIPGVALSAAAGAHSLWLRSKFRDEVIRAAGNLHKQVSDQRQHALMLWPRPWTGGRPLSQVEEIIEQGKGWLGEPLDPEEQHRQMMENGRRLLDSYRPRDAKMDE